MADSKKPRVLVIGVGSIGTRHLRLIHGMGHPVAGCDTDPAAFDRVREDVPDIETFLDLDPALESRPDLVVVATAHHLHAPHAVAALEAGAHVLCEKPMADTVEAADRMIEAARRAGKVLHVGLMNRYHPCVARARELVASGALGVPLFAQADLGSYRTLICSRSRYQSQVFGALLLDYTHQLDFVPYVLGAPATRVYAVSRARGDFELKSDPNVISLILEHGDGPVSEIHLDYCRNPQVNTLSVTGDEGYVTCDFERRIATLGTRKDESVREETLPGDYDDVYRESFRQFVAATKGEQANIIPGQEGRQSLAIVTAALESLRTRAPVDLPSA